MSTIDSACTLLPIAGSKSKIWFFNRILLNFCTFRITNKLVKISSWENKRWVPLESEVYSMTDFHQWLIITTGDNSLHMLRKLVMSTESRKSNDKKKLTLIRPAKQWTSIPYGTIPLFNRSLTSSSWLFSAFIRKIPSACTLQTKCHLFVWTKLQSIKRVNNSQVHR